MRKSFIVLGLSALLAIPVLTTVQAQPKGSEKRGQGRGGGEFRRSAKMQLGRLWHGFGELEKGKTPLNKKQARKAVDLIKPWTKKSTMSENEATNLVAKLRDILTADQKKALKDARGGGRGEGGRGEGRGGGGERRGGGDRPRGEGRGGGEGFDRKKMEKTMTFFKTVNPFYAPSSYKEYKELPEQMQKGMTRRYESSKAILAGLSKKAG